MPDVAYCGCCYTAIIESPVCCRLYQAFNSDSKGLIIMPEQLTATRPEVPNAKANPHEYSLRYWLTKKCEPGDCGRKELRERRGSA
jgi:hypothetical protein